MKASDVSKLKTNHREAQENHKKIIALKKETTRSFILLGKELKRNKERRYFEDLGYFTFEGYIESPAVSLGRRSVYSLIGIYETFVEELGYSLDELSAVDYSKLDRVLPVINVQPVAHRKWFERAKTLPRKALEQEVKLAQKRHDKSKPKPLSLAVPEKHTLITKDSGISDSGDLERNRIYQGDALEVLRIFPDECVDCIVTSPPYYGLRDYGVEGQLGLESTCEEYLEKMLEVTKELKRVLKKTGTLWWNHGDSYASKGSERIQDRTQTNGFPAKCLMLQPYRLAQRMIDEQGWILRNIIIWHKPNCMPSSVKDRFTVDFEPILFFTKSKKYWFEQQFEPHKEISIKRKEYGLNQTNEPMKAVNVQNLEKMGNRFVPAKGRNKRSVWKVSTQPYPEAHFAVYPPKLIEIPIKAGCPEFICKNCGVAKEKIREVWWTTGSPPQEISYTDCNCDVGWDKGLVLDPFMGSGTTALVALELNRRFIGIELNPEYIEMARRRIKLFLQQTELEAS